MCVSLFSVSCPPPHIDKDITIKLPTAWVLPIDIGYWCSPLPDKLSAEDRSLQFELVINSFSAIDDT